MSCIVFLCVRFVVVLLLLQFCVFVCQFLFSLLCLVVRNKLQHEVLRKQQSIDITESPHRRKLPPNTTRDHDCHSNIVAASDVSHAKLKKTAGSLSAATVNATSSTADSAVDRKQKKNKDRLTRKSVSDLMLSAIDDK